MARPTVIQDATIIEAAREVFLERGIRATTAEVARRAGISEGTIFKRFKSKLELFEAAMLPDYDEPRFLRELPERIGRGTLHRNLLKLGQELLAHLRTFVPLVMMAWSNSSEATPAALSGDNPPPLALLRAVAHYFDGEMRAGRIRNFEPDLLARAFLGAIHNFVAMEVLYKNHAELATPADRYLRGLIRLFEDGIIPPEGDLAVSGTRESAAAKRSA